MNKRKIATNGMIALAVMLFVAMYYAGKDMEEKHASQLEVQQEEGFSFSTKDSQQLEQKGAEKKEELHMQTHGNLTDSEVEQNIRPLEDAPLNERTYTASDFYTAAEIVQAKQVATEFATKYYTFNGEDMTAHVKSVQPLTTDDFYRYLLERTGRATNSAYKSILKDVEVTETYDQVQDYIVFAATISGEVYSSDGSLFEGQSYVYYIKVKQVVNEFKVIDLQQTMER